MKQIFSKLIIIVAVLTFVGISLTANAQAVMPVLYNAQGEAVNTGSGNVLNSGTYYLNNNATAEVYYYGNGRYYDPRTMTYWQAAGNIPTSGASIANIGVGQSQSVAQGTVITPGVPNTGAGGNALANWLMLAGTVLTLGAFAYAIAKIKTI